MSQPADIETTVIAGYLGAGKTTVVNHILRSADERVAVLVNDFGDINIDEDLIESRDDDTISLANGCICCSLVDGFGEAMAAIGGLTPRPERLVIEASGVAYPGPVAAHAQTPGFHLDGVVVVADGEQLVRQIRDEYVGDVIAGQLTQADLVVVTKGDLVGREQRAEALAAVAARTSAPVIEAEFGRVPVDVLVGLDRRPAELGVAHSPTDADARFRSWTEPFPQPIAESDLHELLEGLGPEVVRVKGVLRLLDWPGRRAVVHRVGARSSITDGGPWDDGDPTEGRLVVIERRAR